MHACEIDNESRPPPPTHVCSLRLTCALSLSLLSLPCEALACSPNRRCLDIIYLQPRHCRPLLMLRPSAMSSGEKLVRRLNMEEKAASIFGEFRGIRMYLGSDAS